MLNLFFAFALALPVVVQDPPKPKPPDPQAVQAAIQKIDNAFQTGQPADRIAAIQAAASLADPNVARAIGHGLYADDRGVKLAAVEALRFLGVPRALEELQDYWRRANQQLRNEPDLAASVLQAIGQYGDPSSIAIFTRNPFETPAYPAIKARVMGLANIRTNQALAGIIGLMRMVSVNTDQSYMSDLRLALYRLSGQDLGDDPNQWFSWYENNQNQIQISKTPPELPKHDQNRWDAYWAKPGAENPKDG